MLLEKEKVKLSISEKRLIIKGWGEEVLNNADIYSISYESDNNIVQGYLAMPTVIEEKIPVIIWNRGGYKKNGALNDFLATGLLGEIASKNYAVLASNYREEDEFGGAEISDVTKLIEIAGDIPECDDSNIGIEGWSRGGMMAYLILKKLRSIKCAVIVAGLSDLEKTERSSFGLSNVFRNYFDKGNEADYYDQLKCRSAVNFYKEIDPKVPVLFIHGSSDKKINYSDSVNIFELLSGLNRKTEYKLQIIEDGDHFLSKSKEIVRKIKFEWYNKYMKNNG